MPEEVQYYTDCTKCGAFGIPIIGDGAPELCINCELTEEDRQYHRDRESGLDLPEAIKEVRVNTDDGLT